MKTVSNYKRFNALIAIIGLIAGGALRTQILAQSPEEKLKAEGNFSADRPVTADTPIEISLSRKLASSEKLAVTIGQLDATALFVRVDERFVYDAKAFLLPIGPSVVTVYLVARDGNWKEVARLPLSVMGPKPKPESDAPAGAVAITADAKEAKDSQVPRKDAPEAKASDGQTAGASEARFEESTTEEKKSEVKADGTQAADEAKAAETKPEEAKAETPAEPTKAEKKSFFKFLPTFTVSIESQPLQENFPIDARPEKRATFTDFNLTGSIKTEAKIGGFSNESNFDLAGSSFKEKTLQFGTLAREAPDVDLSSYLMNFKIAKAKVSLGHTSFGSNRHLVNSFSSRGISLNIPINKYLDVTGGFLNGTSVLGVKNFLGVSQIRHQMQGGTLGIEFFPKRQNALRVEVTAFNGYLQALNGVSEGQVVDAERSRGFGLRFITSDKTDRFKIEAGYALSRFFNAKDTTLDPNGTAVPIAAVIRSAYYIDSTNQLLKDIKLSKKKSLNLSFGFKYEYVEPLYRSLGASPSADKATQDYSIDASIGEITFQAGHGRSNDNLRNVPSILKLLTRQNRFSVALPMSALVGQSEKPSPFLPRLGYSIDRTNNFGAAIPVNGGFEVSESTIPNLVNTNQTASSAWQFKKFNFGYTYSRSYADNRQAGNEEKDQLGWVHGISVGLNPADIVSFTVGFSFDSQRNFELSQINRTKTLNLGTTWKPFKNATFTGELAQTLAGDAAKTSLTRNVNYSGQFAYSFSLEKSRFRKFGMQAVARFADAFVRNRKFIEVSNTQTRTKIMTAGLTVNFF